MVILRLNSSANRKSLNSSRLDDLIADHEAYLVGRYLKNGMSEEYANKTADERMQSVRKYLDFDRAKQLIINMLASGTQKTVQIVPISSDASWEEIQELGKMIRHDADIEAAIKAAGVIGHRDYGHNRYAQGSISLKFRVTQSKTGKSGWSDWS